MVLVAGGAVGKLAGLLQHFGWTPAKDVLELVCLSKNAGAWCAGLLWETAATLGNSCPGQDGEGWVCRKAGVQVHC